jgi:formylglycine-generating enzyme required for sulfatase activity
MAYFDPVSVEEYKAFLGAHPNHERPLKWEEQIDHPLWPVLGISALDADAFAEWSGRRLPSDEELVEHAPRLAYYEVTTTLTQDKIERSIRGAAWDGGPWGVRLGSRLWVRPGLRQHNLGFRCARTYLELPQ